MKYKIIIKSLITINKYAKKGISEETSKKFQAYCLDNNINIYCYDFIDLYQLKNVVINKLLQHGKLQPYCNHWFSKGGVATACRSKFRQKGEVHSFFTNEPSQKKKLKSDGLLLSTPDKESGLYDREIINPELAIKILLDYLVNYKINHNIAKKNQAILLRKYKITT